MSPARNYILFVLCALVASSTLLAQNSSWSLKKNEEGIKVYTRSNETSELDDFKGETTINAGVSAILEVLQNVDRYTEWMPDCDKASLLKRGEKFQFHYLITEAPFPVSDRDMVVEMRYVERANGYKVEMSAKPDYYPIQEDMVRIPFMQGAWELVSLGENQTAVSYHMRVDPGGSVPAWLANSTAVDSPFNTLKAMREFID